jgi:TolB-like protein/predicted Ser/Thr protein kinase/Tfp pilus assembly protein PilF
MPETATIEQACRKCGATASRDGGDKLCAACLLEAALIDDDAHSATGPVLMDFGDYELLEELGRGGQGVVYRARQKGLNRIVALKIIGLGYWATEAHLKRFRLEAEAAAQLDHTAIVPIYEIGERDGACFFSMKFIEGGQLDELVRRKPLSLREGAELLAKIARTVHHAHENGVLHRDIKPGNILLDRNGEPHLTDFGLARLVEKESNVTRTMDVLGTPSYMAPEQAAGKNATLTSATDVYGLGAVFYHVLTGQPPFAGGTTYETIRLVLETEPRKPRSWNPKVDRDLETVCLKCLEKDPRKRYESALELAEDLEHWLRHEPIRARRSSIVYRGKKWVRRHPVLAAVTPLAIALVTVVATMLWQNQAEAAPPAGIAVLPFENLSDDKESALLADGLQDDILTKLAKIADLKVISRTSVMGYRGERNVRKIANALRVSHVLEGSVRKMDGRIRINAQLIDARNDTHIWAETYEQPQSEIFALESQLAKEVAARLTTKVSRAEKTALQTEPTKDLEAYNLYLRAKALDALSIADDARVYDAMTQTVDLLEKAVARDPNFALAYCLLAETNLMLYWRPGRVDSAALAQAETALRAAERLAPDAGETHLARAYFYHYGKLDSDHALEALEKAARSLPNNPEVFRTSALIERRLGRWREALRHFAKSSELDPRNPTRLDTVIQTNNMLRRYAEAEEMADRGIAAFPEAADQFWAGKAEAALAQGDLRRAQAAVEKILARDGFPFLRFGILLYGRNYAEAERFMLAQWQGKDPDFARYYALPSAIAARFAGETEKMHSFLLAAREAYELSLDQETPNPASLSDLGIIEAGLGLKESALEKSRKAVELRPINRDAIEGPEYAAHLAQVYASIGDRDRAIEQLSSLVRIPHGVTYGDLKLDPTWDSIRDDPRFAKLLEEAAKPLL